MKKWFLVVFFAMKAHGAADLNFISFSAPTTQAPDSIFQGQSVSFDPNAQVLKVAMAFSEAVSLSKVRVESCAGEFHDGAEFFMHPGELSVFSEGGRDAHTGSLLGNAIPVATVAIHLKLNRGVCLKSLKLFDKAGKPLEVAAPNSVRAQSDQAVKLRSAFDLRPDTALELPSPQESYQLMLDKPRKITAVRLWNGEQATSAEFQQSRKIATLMLSGESGDKQTVKLNSTPGAQLIQLAAPITAKTLVLRASEAGSVSEIRFIGPEGEFFPWFDSGAGLGERPLASLPIDVPRFIDREIIGRDDAGDWIFRFRSDGSAFIKGRIDQAKTASRFVFSGQYEILEAKDLSTKVSVHGTRRVSGLAWDGWRCGVACGEEDGATSTEVSDTLVLETKRGNWMLRNRTAARKRGLPFSDLRVKVSTLDE